jgi:hypothetical protein
MLRTLTAPLLIAATMAEAQIMCPDAPPPPDPCLVGLWIGQSDAQERVRAGLEAMGMGHIGVIPDAPPAIAMSILADGQVFTLPFRTGTTALISDEDGIDTLRLDLAVASQAGYIWTAGSEVSWCGGSAGVDLLGMDLTTSDGRRGAATVGTGEGPSPGAFMTYSCGPGGFTMTVALPPPVGPVTHRFAPLDPERLTADERDMLTMR